jgi:GT2 family glycosyltransferase
VTAILIVNWNGWQDTIACLGKVLAQVSGQDYLFLIDNGSTDDSVEQISSWLEQGGHLFGTAGQEELESAFVPGKKIWIVRNGSNLGFGGANNVVLTKLKSIIPACKYVWLLNNDAFPHRGALDALKNAMESDPRAGACGSLLVNYPDEKTIQCAGVRYYPWLGVSKLVDKNLPLEEFLSGEPAFDYLNGASVMFSVEALDSAGYFDPAFFLYSEEHDLQLRIQERGYHLRLARGSLVSHRLSASSIAARHRFFYHYNRSAVILSRKHRPLPANVSAGIALAVITFIRAFPSGKAIMSGMRGILGGFTQKV